VSHRSSSEEGVLDNDHNSPPFRRRKRKSKCDNTPPSLSRATSGEKIEGKLFMVMFKEKK